MVKSFLNAPVYLALYSDQGDNGQSHNIKFSQIIVRFTEDKQYKTVMGIGKIRICVRQGWKRLIGHLIDTAKLLAMILPFIFISCKAI